MKRRWQRAVIAYKATKTGCWAEDTWPGVRHTCRINDALHTGPHQCCCRYEWDDTGPWPDTPTSPTDTCPRCGRTDHIQRPGNELPFPSDDCPNCRSGVCGGHVGPYSMPVRSAGGGDQPDTPCPQAQP